MKNLYLTFRASATLLTVLALLCFSCSPSSYYSFQTMMQALDSDAESPYKQVTFERLMERYLDSRRNTPEGIYSVSKKVSKISKSSSSSEEKERVTESKENFAKVAIIKDKDSDNRFLEIPLLTKKSNAVGYDIRGEFVATNQGTIYLYNHFHSPNRQTTYTFDINLTDHQMEGVRTEVRNNSTVTHRLVYVKIYPK